MIESVELIPAPELVAGDALLNLGTVVSTERVGVFIVVLVQSERWSLATGMRVTTQWDLVLHTTEEILAMRAGS